MEFATEYDHVYGDILFDAFDADTFYEEIQRSPEYRYRLRLDKLNLRNRLTKLQPGLTIIRGGKIICHSNIDKHVLAN